MVGRAPRLRHLRPSRWLSGTLAVLAAAWLAVLIVPSTPWALLELPVLVGSRLLAQGHLRRRPPTSTSALAILDRPIPWSRLGLLAALPMTATAIYALAGVTLASTDRLRARQQTLIWSQTAIGWADFLAALLAARRTGRGGVG